MKYPQKRLRQIEADIIVLSANQKALLDYVSTRLAPDGNHSAIFGEMVKIQTRANEYLQQTLLDLETINPESAAALEEIISSKQIHSPGMHKPD